MSLPWNEKVVSFQVSPESATIADIVRMAEEYHLLKLFYEQWESCENNRGCYSCCDAHDIRCPKRFNEVKNCECGRDDLENISEKVLLEIYAK